MGETLLKPGSHVGSYVIVRLIAAGGMGEVYLATHATMGRQAAIKVIFPYLAQDEKFIERWRREARALASLRHPHIVEIYDAGVSDGLYYLAMEYLPNGTLKLRQDELHKQQASMPANEALTVAQQMAVTLDHAHRNGIVHRDVKPSNILIAADGRYVLSDFGIAAHLGAARVTRDYGTLGSAEYMSPEQAQGLEVTPRSDVYSLGVVTFEMLAGRLPFVADTVMALLYKHVNEPPPTLTRLRVDLPPGIKEVVNKALEKNPAKRYSSAGEMATALQALIAQKTAAPSSRRIGVFAGIAIVALVGSGVVIASAMQPVSGPPRDATATLAPVATEALGESATAIVIKAVPTDTPAPTATNTPQPTDTPQPTSTATRTPAPTATNTPRPTSTNTPQPTATATMTPRPTATPIPPTNTPVPPTRTPVPTPTMTPAPTRAPLRTRTPVPPTSTPLPPTPTEAPAQPTSPPQNSGGGGGDQPPPPQEQIPTIAPP